MITLSTIPIFVFIVSLTVGLASRYFFYGNTADPLSFWGRKSWMRKYKLENGKLVKAPNNKYYSYFNVKYKEKFPLSTTALVFVTDGAHLMQFLATTIGLFAIVVASTLCLSWSYLLIVEFVVLRIIYSIGFNWTYNRR